MAVITKTLRSAGGDYSLMSLWESTEQTDLVSTGDSHVLECDAFTITNTDSPTIGGWTTGVGRGILVRPAAGAEHGGMAGTGFKNTHTTNSAFHAIAINQDYTTVKGLTFEMTGSTNNNPVAIIYNTGIERIFDSCIFLKNNSHSSGGVEIRVGVGTTNGVRNSLVIDVNGSGLGVGVRTLQVDATIAFLHSCTIIGFNNGVEMVTGYINLDIQNCVAYGAANDDLQLLTAGVNNASGDLTGDVTGVLTADFVDYAGGNYRPTETGVLFGAGTDLSGTFTEDIRGETYAEWSIGAYDTPYVLRTLKSSGGDYSTMSLWESSEQTDLTVSGDRHILHCYNFVMAATSTIDINGWTTSAAYNITITCPDGEWHNGNPNDGFQISSNVQGSEVFVTRSPNHVDISRMRVHSTNQFFGSWINLELGAIGTFSDSIVLVNSGRAINPFFTNLRNVQVTNSDVVNTGSTCYYSQGFDNSLDNCTMIGGVGGMRTGDGDVVRNCVVYGAGLDGDFFGTTPTVSSNNASSDATAVGTSPVINITSAAFVDYAGGNYRPTETGVLFGAGLDLSGTFTEDIRNETIAEWSIGAFDTPYVLRTLKATGGDYSSIVLWESSEQADLSAIGDRHILKFDAMTLNETLNLTGWSTSADHFITIEPADGQEHGGVLGAGLVLTGIPIFTACVTVVEEYTVIRGIEVDLTATALANKLCFVMHSTNVVFDQCIAQVGTGSNNHGFSDANSWGQGVFRNCLAISSSGSTLLLFGVLSTQAAGIIEFDNCTAIVLGGGGEYKFYDGQGAGIPMMIAKNCVAIGGTIADYVLGGAGATHASSTNNASEDTSATGTSPVINITTADFVDHAGGNYRPIETGVLFGAGVDLSADFTADIRGETIAESSIGAFDTPWVLRTLKASGGDYSDMALWESTEQTNLSVSGDRHILHCYNFIMSTSSFIQVRGWNSTAAYNITITCPDGEWHEGNPDDGFQIYTSATSGAVLWLDNDDYIDFSRIRIHAYNQTVATGDWVNVQAYAPGVFEDVIIRMNAGVGIKVFYTEIRNVLIVSDTNTTGRGVLLQGFGTTLDNCTVIGAKEGITSFGFDIIRNCVSYGSGTSGAFTGASHASDSNNASDDATALGASPVINITAAAFVDFAGGNYAAVIGGALAGTAIDLSADFLDDITGTLR